MEQKDFVNPVFVSWVDPHSVDEWSEVDEVEMKHPLIHSVGYLIKQTKDTLVIALNYDQHDEKISCSMVLPMSCVREIKQVKILGDLELISNER